MYFDTFSLQVPQVTILRQIKSRWILTEPHKARTGQDSSKVNKKDTHRITPFPERKLKQERMKERRRRRRRKNRGISIFFSSPHSFLVFPFIPHPHSPSLSGSRAALISASLPPCSLTQSSKSSFLVSSLEMNLPESASQADYETLSNSLSEDLANVAAKEAPPEGPSTSPFTSLEPRSSISTLSVLIPQSWSQCQ